MQGWVFEMQSARPRCMAPGRLHLENPTLHVGPGFYYPEKIPPCLFTFNRISSTGSAVCISNTHLCRSDPDFTILLILREIGSLHLENPTLHVGPGFYYPEKIPPCLFTFNRISSTGSAVCISKTHLCRSDPDFTILLFYYFTILLILREIGSLHLENPTLHVGPGFYYPEKIPPCLFTFNRISSTGSTVCISKTHLCRSDPDFTILLFYYFTILLFTILLFYYFTILLFYYFTNFTGNREFASRKPNLACRTRILLSRENSSLSLYF